MEAGKSGVQPGPGPVSNLSANESGTGPADRVDRLSATGVRFAYSAWMPKKTKAARSAKKASQHSDTAYVLKVALREVRPPIWRRLRVAADLSLRDLHHVLQVALGWTDSHLHEFEIGGRRYGMPAPEEDYGEPPLDEQDHRLSGLLRKGSRAEYIYDFGDGWQHDIVVESEVSSIGTALKAECLAGARARPPEDCGGAPGYADLLEALADPSNERHAALKEWVGPHFAPEELDLASVNRELRGAGSAAWRRKRERFYGS
jgi:hypothetical protein